MLSIFSKINIFLKKIKSQLSPTNIGTKTAFVPHYRVVSIEKNKKEEFEALIQLIGKATIFRMKPEEILADDKMTDQFSPRDVRTLTYLGYLDMNTPKYRVLARRLSENENRMIFAIHQKGGKTPLFKTAAEISKDKEMIKQIDQSDAHMIGYISATEAVTEETREKEKLLKQIEAKE